MDDQDLALDFDDLGGDTDMPANTEAFYWALKNALERTQADLPPVNAGY